jgi:outer membrane receptor protein involved in Fe transport
MITPKNHLIRASVFTMMLLFVFAPDVRLLAKQQDANESADFFEMSLTELMEVSIYVPATITEKNPLKIPASVTVITAEDIARTPARNLMDLMEIYVPGFLWMNHSAGPLPGMRGIIVDRPYKFLVNVNGINVNIKTYYGARLELLNWELNDIQRIEIIRGPGSVTYGPGAIGGVINIFTKTASESSGLAIGGHFWDRYDSIGNYVSYGRKTDKLDLYAYFSIVRTAGHSPDLFACDWDSSNGYRSGYMGGPKASAPEGPYPPADIFADYDNQPQIKALLDVHFKENWRFWARYVTSSYDRIEGTAQKYVLPNKNSDTDYENFRQTRHRYYQFALENQTPLSKNWNLKSLFAFSSTDVHNIDKYNGNSYTIGGVKYYYGNDRANMTNIQQIFSENEYFTRFMFNYKPDDEKIKAAFGFEFSYDTIRPAWGKNEDNGLRIVGIMSGPSSEAYGSGSDAERYLYNETDDEYFAVGKGWETFSHAFLGELNVKWAPKTSIILSARLDKHTYTDYMFSPRFALIHELKKDEYLKFIAQRSVRMNTQEELYMNHELDEDNEPEELDTLELIYSGKLTKNLSFQASGFYNKNKAIAWDWGLRKSAPVGTLKTFGLELETKYQKDNFNIGLNHSFVKQLDWDLADDVSVSGISYSDYYQVTDTTPGVVTISSKGNDLSNWSNHATKLYTNIDLLDKKLTLHGNMQVFWGFQGLKDGLNALSAAGGNASEITHIKDQSGYEMQATAGVSLTYHINKSSDVTVFVHGIPVIGDNKRYSYSSGYKDSYPDKTSWVEEPIVVGFRYYVRF